jgi:alkylhydroperoxidase family enzyme
VAAHSTIAAMSDVPDEVVSAIREDRPIGDEKLETLRCFVHAVVKSRGWPDDADVQAFLDAGYGRQQVLEVVLGIAMKTMSNYTNHIAGIPLDEAFEAAKWTAPTSKVA